MYERTIRQILFKKLLRGTHTIVSLMHKMLRRPGEPLLHVLNGFQLHLIRLVIMLEDNVNAHVYIEK